MKIHRRTTQQNPTSNPNSLITILLNIWLKHAINLG